MMFSHASRSVNCFKRDDDRNIQVTSIATPPLPPNAPHLLTEENIEQPAAKKRKSAHLRPMKEWRDEEMTVLVRAVRAHQGHIKTGTVHSIVFFIHQYFFYRNRHEV